jgi:hypothetical protein
MPESDPILPSYHLLTCGGSLIEAPAERVVYEASVFLSANRLPQRNPQLSRYERIPDVARSLENALKFLVPMVSNMATRYLVTETANPSWTLLLHNHAKVRGDTALCGWLTQVLSTRAVGWCCQEHTLKKERGGELSGYPGGTSFDIHVNGEQVRSIACVYEGKTWRFAQFGTPYEFEEVARYAAPRKKDRLTCEMVRNYLAALGVFPWEQQFYRVDSEHSARGIRFVSDDPAMNAWLEPVL